MKLVDMKCTACGAQMSVNGELNICTCNYCGNTMIIDHEEKNINIKNGFELGYEVEKGRASANKDLERERAHSAIYIINDNPRWTCCKNILNIDNKQYTKEQLVEDNKGALGVVFGLILVGIALCAFAGGWGVLIGVILICTACGGISTVGSKNNAIKKYDEIHKSLAECDITGNYSLMANYPTINGL